MAILVEEALDFDEIVERELREQATPEQCNALQHQKIRWRLSLLQLKKKTEVQFTAARSRIFNAWWEYQEVRDDVTRTDEEVAEAKKNAFNVIKKEKEWRHKANFFLSKIEQRLNALHTGDV